MLKFVSKFTMDILPSVVATIIGAYIVNHYIVTKPGTGGPVAAVLSSVAPKEADVKNDAKRSETSSNLPEAGVRAKGISEKAIFEKSVPEKEKSLAEKPPEKSADKPAETASIPVETRRHQPAPREKAIAKAVPAPVQPSAPATAAPAVAASVTAPAAEVAVAPQEHRDANDLARAAIERLRGANEGSPRTQEAARIPDAPRVASAPPVQAPPSVRPLPPPIMVSTPAAETFDAPGSSSQMNQPRRAAAPTDDPSRPTPPADIPEATQPLDLRAEAVEPPPPRREHTNVAEDVLTAAKSVFHAVLPK
jgi:hypothetical protein